MTNSLWLDKQPQPKFPKLQENVTVDICVVGGGIVGITTAYLLKKAGLTVALIDKGGCGQAETGHTTAHLTYVTDERLSRLVSDFGRDHAQAAWDAGQAALLQIAENVHVAKIDCGFAWTPGYMHASWKHTDQDDRASLEEEARLALELGFAAEFVESVPFADRPGIRFANQARFHPQQYLAGLLATIPAAGSYVFQESEVTEITEEPLTVHVGEHKVTCGYVVVATHVPLMGKAGLVAAAFLQSKLSLYSTYAIAARVPKGEVPAALFWDTTDPYYYLRTEPHEDHDMVIFGGEDHKTGQVTDTEDNFKRLEQLFHVIVPKGKVTHRWSGQVVETNDGLPFIGEIASRQFIATGFSGNGLTYGTLSGMMALDWALGAASPWHELFSPGRTKLKGGTWDYLRENIDYPYYMLKDRLFGGHEAGAVESVDNGEGKVLMVDGERLAVSRDDKGHVCAVSAICTHMGCVVHWNQAEKSWDCPCHGSRFSADGSVMAGPAETPLAKHDIAAHA